MGGSFLNQKKSGQSYGFLYIERGEIVKIKFCLEDDLENFF